MKTYVLIDYENVQPKDLARLQGHSLRVLVFVGASQRNVPLDLAEALQPMGAAAEYIHIKRNAQNALDFHIAFYLGHFAANDPGGSYFVVTKDKDLDPLLERLNARGIRARRCRSLSEVSLGGNGAAVSVADRVSMVVKNLVSRGAQKPGSVKALSGTINALFGKALQQSEIDELIAMLEKRGAIAVKDGKIAYAL